MRLPYHNPLRTEGAADFRRLVRKYVERDPDSIEMLYRVHGGSLAGMLCGYSQSWLCRKLNPDQLERHRAYNREWRKRMKQIELDALERLSVAVESLPQRLAAALEPVLHGLLDDYVELLSAAEQERALTLGRVTGALRTSIEKRN